MSDKIQITDEMVESFASMIRSKDKADTTMALDILENRDKADQTSETNFKKISNLIIDDDQLFPMEDKWIIQAAGKMLVLDRGNCIFWSESSAQRALSSHLTKWIGKSVKNININYQYDEIIKYKTTAPDNKKYNDRVSYSWERKFYAPNNLRQPDHYYDPKFNKREYIKKQKEKIAKELGSNLQWGQVKNKQYFKALKEFFGGGKELRDFLIKEQIVQIVKL